MTRRHLVSSVIQLSVPLVVLSACTEERKNPEPGIDKNKLEETITRTTKAIGLIASDIEELYSKHSVSIGPNFAPDLTELRISYGDLCSVLGYKHE